MSYYYQDGTTSVKSGDTLDAFVFIMNAKEEMISKLNIAIEKDECANGKQGNDGRSAMLAVLNRLMGETRYTFNVLSAYGYYCGRAYANEQEAKKAARIACGYKD